METISISILVLFVLGIIGSLSLALIQDTTSSKEDKKRYFNFCVGIILIILISSIVVLLNANVPLKE